MLAASSRRNSARAPPLSSGLPHSAGARLFAASADTTRENVEGYTTSVAFSPSLGHFIGLGFLRDGPNRVGEVVKMVDHVRKVETTVEVCSPVFLDPEGEKLRG